MASLLDGGAFTDARPQQFPASEEDVKKLMDVVFQATHNPDVQKALIQRIQGNPGSTPDVVAQMGAMITQRILAQVKESFGADMPEQNIMGLLLTIISELYAMVEEMGGQPVDDRLLQETAKIAVSFLDQFDAQGQQGQGGPPGAQGGAPPQGPSGPPQGPPNQGGTLL